MSCDDALFIVTFQEMCPSILEVGWFGGVV
jgi:hypothetical protein